MPEQIRRCVVAANRLIDKCRDEVKHLLTRCLCTDEVIDTIDLERLCNVGEYFIFPVALKAVEEHAHIRPAEIKCEVVAALRARRQSEVGRQHAQRGVGRARKSEAHILAKICRHLMQMLRIHRKGGNDSIVKRGIERHLYSSSCTAGFSCASNTLCSR